MGASRNFLHKEFGANCLMDTVITNLEFNEEELDTPIEWNPCVGCGYCVAACPSGAIKSDGDFDFFSCFNHTYRDSIPAFTDLVRDLSAARPKRFRKRWNDAEIAALWQSMTFHVEYRCFNCVGVCTAHMHEAFQGSKEVRQEERDLRMMPLKRTRGEIEQRFVIDTPSAREKYGIPPGEWRTPPDPSKPGQGGVRLVELDRLRVSNVDTMMRLMPHVFRGSEADGLDFTVQFDLSGAGGGKWVMRVVDNRCQVHPGETESPDLTIRCAGELFLKIHREEVNPVLAILTGKLKLKGDRKIFLTFPRILASTPGHSLWHRLAWRFSGKAKKSKNASKDNG